MVGLQQNADNSVHPGADVLRKRLDSDLGKQGAQDLVGVVSAEARVLGHGSKPVQRLLDTRRVLQTITEENAEQRRFTGKHGK